MQINKWSLSGVCVKNTYWTHWALNTSDAVVDALFKFSITVAKAAKLWTHFYFLILTCHPIWPPNLWLVQTICFNRARLTSRETAWSSRSCPGSSSPDRHVSVSSRPEGGTARSGCMYLAHHSLSSPQEAGAEDTGRELLIKNSSLCLLWFMHVSLSQERKREERRTASLVHIVCMCVGTMPMPVCVLCV